MGTNRPNIVNPVPLTFTCLTPCPPPQPKISCCTFILEHKTQLVPPAKKGTTKVKKELFAEIEKVCEDVIVICGFLRKTITYTAVKHHCDIENYTIVDEVPFQCLIENVKVKKDEKVKIVEKEIVCEVYGEEMNFGKDQNGDLNLAFRYKEKDIIKICVKQKKKKKKKHC